MIPKIIHYCWLSDDPIPSNMQRCIDSWRLYLPEYKFVLWNFDNFDKDTSVWVKEAFQKKKYAFAADYLRLFAIYNYGGFYLDMDVEILQSFNDLLDLDSVICWQDNYEGFEAACFGAKKNSPWVKACLDHYTNRHFIQKNGKIDITPLPEILEKCIKKSGFQYKGVCSINQAVFTEKTKLLPILPSYFFSPKSYKTGKITTNKETHAIHHFAASWVNAYDNLSLLAKIWKILHLPNTNLRKKISHIVKK